MDREMEGYISPFFFWFRWEYQQSEPPPPAPLSCSLQLQIALPPLPPAVCPAKSAHDVSLSQLWVEIHRINRFVRETHAWDCLHAVRLVHLLVRPILPQATKKGKKKEKKKPTTSASVYSRCTQSPHSYRKIRRPACAYANDTMRSINFTKAQIYPRRYLCYHLYLPVYSSIFASHLPSSFPYLSVLYFISRAGQQDLDGRLFPCNYCPVNRSEGQSPATAAAAFSNSHTYTRKCMHSCTHNHTCSGCGSRAFRVVLIGWAVTSPKPCHPCERSLQIDQ